MFIEVGQDGDLKLCDAHNFKAFKIVNRSMRSGSDLNAALSGVATLASDNIAWVRREAVPRLFGEKATPDWLAAYDAMLCKAASFGWIDPDSGDIRAHIEIAN